MTAKMATLAGMAIGRRVGFGWAWKEGGRRAGRRRVGQPFEFIELSKPLAGIVLCGGATTNLVLFLVLGLACQLV